MGGALTVVTMAAVSAVTHFYASPPPNSPTQPELPEVLEAENLSEEVQRGGQGKDNMRRR